MPKSIPGRRLAASASLLAVSLATSLIGCQSREAGNRVEWRAVTQNLPTGSPGSLVIPDAVEPGTAGKPWLLGGVVVTPAPPATEGLVVTDERRQVAIWEAPSPAGPWKLATMRPVPGRDGPFESILYLTRRGATSVAFGSRPSPTEGYPRPSTWTDQGGEWVEAPASRELFGGPNIVGFGGMAGGPHGFFVAGTWSDDHGHPEAQVWRSEDGLLWSRVSDGSFEGSPGETPFGEGIADGPPGVLLIATVETPTPRDPGAERGGAWYSRDGSTWRRVSFASPDGSTFGAVIGTTTGWIVAGTVKTAAGAHPAVWSVDSHQVVGPARLLPGGAGSAARVSSIWTDGSTVTIGGVVDGSPYVWSGEIKRSGIPVHWTRSRLPRDGSDAQRVIGANSGRSSLIVVTSKAGGVAWRS